MINLDGMTGVVWSLCLLRLACLEGGGWGV